jgi:hypothetical protein
MIEGQRNTVCMSSEDMDERFERIAELKRVDFDFCGRAAATKCKWLEGAQGDHARRFGTSDGG